ncbi:hypothetical protein, partial [Thiolapillus sp.]
YAAACKAVDLGSIPGSASNFKVVDFINLASIDNNKLGASGRRQYGVATLYKGTTPACALRLVLTPA